MGMWSRTLWWWQSTTLPAHTQRNSRAFPASVCGPGIPRPNNITVTARGTHAGQILESPSCLDNTCLWLLSSTDVLHRHLERSVIYAHWDYPERPRLLGERPRRRKLDLRLQIKEVAAAIGVCETTIINWERRGVMPSPRLLRRIREYYRATRHSLAVSL